MSEPDDIGGLAFWLRPDWSGGDNLRDPGTVPFWMAPPPCPRRAAVAQAIARLTPAERMAMWQPWAVRLP